LYFFFSYLYIYTHDFRFSLYYSFFFSLFLFLIDPFYFTMFKINWYYLRVQFTCYFVIISWFSIDILLWYVCMLVIFVLIMFHHLLIFYVCRCCYLDLYLYEQLSKIIHTAFQSLHFTMIFALYKSSIFLLFEITFFIHLLLHEYANLMF